MEDPGGSADQGLLGGAREAAVRGSVSTQQLDELLYPVVVASRGAGRRRQRLDQAHARVGGLLGDVGEESFETGLDPLSPILAGCVAGRFHTTQRLRYPA